MHSMTFTPGMGEVDEGAGSKTLTGGAILCRLRARELPPRCMNSASLDAVFLPCLIPAF